MPGTTWPYVDDDRIPGSVSPLDTGGEALTQAGIKVVGYPLCSCWHYVNRETIYRIPPVSKWRTERDCQAYCCHCRAVFRVREAFFLLTRKKEVQWEKFEAGQDLDNDGECTCPAIGPSQMAKR